MKKIMVLSLCFISLQAIAQTEDPLRDKLNAIFQPLNKAQIPTGYLAEYGTEFTPLHWYNGILTDSNLVFNLDIFKMIYADVETAKIVPTAPTLPASEITGNLLDSLSKARTTNEVAVLLGSYASLKPTAISENLLGYNSQQQNFYDIPNRSSLPYIQKMVFAVAPIQQKFFNTVYLQYNTNFFYSNNNASLQSLAVNFLDGQGYQALNAAGLSHTYTDSSGLKEVIFRGETTPGQFVYSKALLNVEVDASANTANLYAANDPFAKVVLIKNLPNAAAYNDYQDRLQIRYSQNNPTRTLSASQQHLRKPIIYVEGYDVGGKNSITVALFPFQFQGELGYNLLDLISTSTDPKERGEWVRLNDPPRLYNFMNDLDEVAGYDLVFVNYNTLRSIEDNANMLRRVIEWVNGDKAAINSTEKNVVVGVSMGGLVARYCLANMTKNIGFNSTDTKLLITHDSPHQGSNVPLGLQYFLYDLGYTKILGNKIKDKISDLKDFMDLNENGASTAQLLRARAIYTNGTVSTAYSTFLTASGAYQQMVNLTPSQRPYKFVATAQGSQCAVPVSGSNITYAHQNGSFGTLAFLSLGYLITGSNYPWLQGWGQKFKLDTELKSLPAQGTAQIEYYKFTKKVSLLGVGLFNIGIKETNRQNPVNFNDWDNVPGSTQSIEGRGGSNLTSGPQKSTSFPINIFVQAKAGLSLTIDNDLFSFVSTTSALDAPPGTSNYVVYSSAQSGNSNTRTDGYISHEFYAGTNNLNHTDYTPRNAKWMYEEMENIPHEIKCNDYCNNYKIEGDKNICTISNPYTVPNLPIGSTLTWSVSPSNIVTINNPNSITTTLTKVSEGDFTLTATVNNSCVGNVTYTKNIYAGLANYAVSFSTGMQNNQTIYEYNPNNSNTINMICQSHFNTPYVEGLIYGTSSNIVWSLASNYPNNGFSYSQSDNFFPNRAKLYIPFGNTNVGYLQGTVENSCGQTTKVYAFKLQYCNPSPSPNPCPYSSNNIIAIASDPSSRNVFITSNDFTYPKDCTPATQYQLNENNKMLFTDVNIYNKWGTLVQTEHFAPTIQKIVVLNQQITDMYVVEVIAKNYIERKQILIL